MRALLLAAALVAAVPAFAQTGPAQTGLADSSLTPPANRPAVYAERALSLGFVSTTGPFAVGLYSTGVRVGHGLGAGVQAVVGELPYDGLPTFVGAGPEVRLDRALGGGARLELRAAGLARFANTVSSDGATGAFGLRSLSASTSATIRRPIRITGGLEIVPRLGVRAVVGRQFGAVPGDAAFADVGTFRSGSYAGVTALAGADIRFRAFKRWWTVPVVAPVPLVGSRFGTLGAYGF